MPINFNEIITESSDNDLVDPIEIFQGLKIKDPAINDLWLAQGDALREWHQKRSEEDVAIVLNTGAGKTLVGLLAAQSMVNETEGHILYACSSIQLVEQTAKKAEGYGIKTTTYFQGEFSNTLFQRGKAPCLTTYHALFNGKSKFFKDSNIKGVIFDDAHTAEHLIRDQWTLCIESSLFPSQFSEIVEIFRNYHIETGRGASYFETIKNKSYNYWFIPPFLIKDNINELNRILGNAKFFDNIKTCFSWEYIKDKVELCCWLVSGKEIVITPPFLPTIHTPYFKQKIKRLYLSATLSTKDKFLRTYGKEPIVISPKTTAGECERLIILPSLNKECKLEKDIEVAKEIIKDKKAVILVPSHRKAEKWSDFPSENIEDDQDSSTLSDKIELFKQSVEAKKLLLVSRYDGVDLPGDTCRLMVIDDLPTSLNPLEKFYWEQLGLVKNLRSAIASRIIQGFGRISRGMSDYGVVIITDQKLANWLLETENNKILPPFLRRQVELGRLISEQSEKLTDLIDAASQCLERDAEWIKFYDKEIKKLESSEQIVEDKDSLILAQIENEFIKHFWVREYQSALKVISQKIDETYKRSSNIAAWHQLWMGVCYDFLDEREKAYNCYREAHAVSKNIPSPVTSDFSITDYPKQVYEIYTYWYSDEIMLKIEKKLKKYNQDVAFLNGMGTPAQTEEAVRCLGQYLGIFSLRPEKEYGTGGDVLWIAHSGDAICMELKTDKNKGKKDWNKKSPYNIDDIGQLRDHIDWLKQNQSLFSDHIKSIYPVFIGEKLPHSPNTNPSREILVLELKELESIAEKLRAVLNDIFQEATPVTLLEVIYKRFQERGLLWEDLLKHLSWEPLINIE